MIGALKRIFGGNGSRESKNVAKSRLSFVLVQDRTGLTQDEIANFKKEMVAVIEKYFVIDETGLDVSYRRETDSTMLIINSPVVVKRQDGYKHQVGATHKSKSNEAKLNENKFNGDGKDSVKSELPRADGIASAVPNPITQNVAVVSVEPEKQAV